LERLGQVCPVQKRDEIFNLSFHFLIDSDQSDAILSNDNAVEFSFSEVESREGERNITDSGDI